MRAILLLHNQNEGQLLRRLLYMNGILEVFSAQNLSELLLLQATFNVCCVFLEQDYITDPEAFLQCVNGAACPFVAIQLIPKGAACPEPAVKIDDPGTVCDLSLPLDADKVKAVIDHVRRRQQKSEVEKTD